MYIQVIFTKQNKANQYVYRHVMFAKQNKAESLHTLNLQNKTKLKKTKTDKIV